MLPTEKATHVCTTKTFTNFAGVETLIIKHNHLYILDTEARVKEEDWFIHPDGYVLKASKYSDHDIYNCKKVIASTDKSLDLPIIPRKLINEYVKDQFEYIPETVKTDEEMLNWNQWLSQMHINHTVESEKVRDLRESYLEREKKKEHIRFQKEQEQREKAILQIKKETKDQINGKKIVKSDRESSVNSNTFKVGDIVECVVQEVSFTDGSYHKFGERHTVTKDNVPYYRANSKDYKLVQQKKITPELIVILRICYKAGIDSVTFPANSWKKVINTDAEHITFCRGKNAKGILIWKDWHMIISS